MEKDVGSEAHAPIKQSSHDWSVKEPSETVDIEHDAPDLEQDGTGEELSRLPSAPPYTIFNHKTKIFIVASVSVSSLISPFGATTFYPALNVLAKQLHVTPTQVNLALTTYMVCYSFSMFETSS